VGTNGDGSEVQGLVADSLSILHKFAESYQPGGAARLEGGAGQAGQDLAA
jgi:hypothetical protein